MNSYLIPLGPALANHLWQSTVFGLLVWLITLGLHRNQARVRYAIWAAASMKFLIPFSLLVSMGNLLPHPRRPVAPIVYSAIDVAEEPFATDAQPQQTVKALVPHPSLRQRIEQALPVYLETIWLLGVTTVLFAWFNRWRILARSTRQAVPATEGRELQILSRLGGAGLPLLISAERMEPGIFGVFRPVLVWPKQLSEHLNNHHIEAIVAHELTHVARRDNLTASIHMLVEAVFWFHPLVWWIERQMIKEREQACDETVVAMGGSAETYAESLLKTCWFCIESPLPCVAGVTGADLTRRVADIITGRVLLGISWPKKLLLALTAVCTIVAPMVLGQERAVWRLANVTFMGTPAKGNLLSVPTTPIDFDVAVFRRSGEKSVRALNFTPDGFIMGARPFHDLIRFAFAKGRGGAYHISGQPSWVENDLYDIQAKVAPEDIAEWQQLNAVGQKVALQGFIIQYLKLKYHPDLAPYPYYALVVGKNGPKIPRYRPGDTFKSRDGRVIFDTNVLLWVGPNELICQDCTMERLAEELSGRGDRGVLDRTGLTSSDYNFDLRFDVLPDPSNPDGVGVPFRRLGQRDATTVLLSSVKQFGLELKSATGPVDGMVVDHINRPPEN